MPYDALHFGDHEDVVFKDAPLTNVLCQVRFEPILSLLDDSGVVGFQEALRAAYPHLDVDRQMEIEVSNKATQLRQTAPVWRLRAEDNNWTVSVAVDFVALEVKSYSNFGEFENRLSHVLAAVDRTLRPSRARRIGLRKINLLSHPDVVRPTDWSLFLRSEILGLTVAEAMPGEIVSAKSEWTYQDASGGALTIRFGPDNTDIRKFILDYDYWTDKHHDEITPTSELLPMVAAFANSITGCFHWSLLDPMKKHLKPVPRPKEDT